MHSVPFFNFYQNAIIGGNESKNIKSNTFQTVQNKMAELIFLLNQSQKNSEIPNFKIVTTHLLSIELPSFFIFNLKIILFLFNIY